MNHQYQITIFRADKLQKLKNVRIHSPSIIQIITGSKRLFWRDSIINISPSWLLLCEASASLSFENIPDKSTFFSRIFNFHCLPSDSMIKLSQINKEEKQVPMLEKDKSLQDTLNALFSFDLQSLSKETQTFLVMGLYQQLAERGVLHRLFVNYNATLTQKLSHYLSHSPSNKHRLEVVTKHFAMSRATMIRKLKQEGTQYREVLAEVRLNHALNVMQSGQYKIAILAQQCGYQSEGRFIQRFKRKFGLTPSEYIKTIVSH